MKEHICVKCGHKWESIDMETEKKVIAAKKVNKDGPFCDLCHYLEMAARTARHRGYPNLSAAVDAWIY